MSYQVITSEFMGGVAGTGMSVSSGSNGFFSFNVGIQVDLGKVVVDLSFVLNLILYEEIL